MARDPAVDALEERLGLALVKDEVALAALTHKSFVNEHRGEGLQDNERLEFLGDAVIDLAVSHRLMERFPCAREGELSKIRAAMVDEAGLARIARELDLGPLLRLGRGEELTGGREKSSLLADAMEAVIAVLYLGGGLEPVLALIDRFLGDAFARAAAGTLDRDYKTQLQELAQSRLRASPRYRVIAEHGPDHSKVFDVELEVKGEVIGRGAGRSKKDAEQAAAKLAIEAMNERLGAVRPAVESEPATVEAKRAPAVPEMAASPSAPVAPVAPPEPAPREPARAEPALEACAAPSAPEEEVASAPGGEPLPETPAAQEPVQGTAQEPTEEPSKEPVRRRAPGRKPRLAAVRGTGAAKTARKMVRKPAPDTARKTGRKTASKVPRNTAARGAAATRPARKRAKK